MGHYPLVAAINYYCRFWLGSAYDERYLSLPAPCLSDAIVTIILWMYLRRGISGVLPEALETEDSLNDEDTFASNFGWPFKRRQAPYESNLFETRVSSPPAQSLFRWTVYQGPMRVCHPLAVSINY
jgi:hypothetical protein